MTLAKTAYLHDVGLVCALGCGKDEVFSALMAGAQPGIVRSEALRVDGAPVYVGAVRTPLPALPAGLARWDSRNARLLIEAARQITAAIAQAKSDFGPERVAVVLGSSTSGIAEGEMAVAALKRDGKLPENFDFARQEMGSVAETLARHFELAGPAYAISTACSAGAQALAAGRRLLRAGLADAVVVGGVDSLCQLTVNGFSALGAVSAGICNPFSRNRDGITIGEGAAVFMMRCEPGPVALKGAGITSDAYSMNAPEPEGKGLEQAVRNALADAGLAPENIAYVQLHGTGTQHNDAMESKAMRRVFGSKLPLMSSSKPQLGHTLGAAGALGAALCWLTLSDANIERRVPPHLFDGVADEGLLYDELARVGDCLTRDGPLYLMSNTSAFGGNNVSLILGREE